MHQGGACHFLATWSATHTETSPSLWGTSRALRKLYVGTTLLISPYLLHRLPERWPQSREFRPQRWLPHLKGNKPGAFMSLFSGLGPNGAYLPFGAGPRCAAKLVKLLPIHKVVQSCNLITFNIGS